MRAIRTIQRHDPMRFQPREEQARHPTVMPHRRRSQSRTGEIRLPTLHDHGQTRNHRLRKPAPAPLAQVHRTGPQIRVAQTRQPAVIEPPLPAETARPLTEGRRGEPRCFASIFLKQFLHYFSAVWAAGFQQELHHMTAQTRTGTGPPCLYIPET